MKIRKLLLILQNLHNLDQLSCDLYEKHCEESDYYEAAMEQRYECDREERCLSWDE